MPANVNMLSSMSADLLQLTAVLNWLTTKLKLEWDKTESETDVVRKYNGNLLHPLSLYTYQCFFVSCFNFSFSFSL